MMISFWCVWCGLFIFRLFSYWLDYSLIQLVYASLLVFRRPKLICVFWWYCPRHKQSSLSDFYKRSFVHLLFLWFPVNSMLNPNSCLQQLHCTVLMENRPLPPKFAWALRWGCGAKLTPFDGQPMDSDWFFSENLFIESMLFILYRFRVICNCMSVS